MSCCWQSRVPHSCPRRLSLSPENAEAAAHRPPEEALPPPHAPALPPASGLRGRPQRAAARALAGAAGPPDDHRCRARLGCRGSWRRHRERRPEPRARDAACRAPPHDARDGPRPGHPLRALPLARTRVRRAARLRVQPTAPLLGAAGRELRRARGCAGARGPPRPAQPRAHSACATPHADTHARRARAR